MKQIYLQQVLPIIKGNIIHGSDQLKIKDVVHSRYLKHMKHSHTLVFLSNNPNLATSSIQKLTPCAVVIDTPMTELFSIRDCTIIQVKNVTKSYHSFIDYYRNQFHIPVIAITGTCGKTTTKDMTKHILNYFYKTEGTYKSTNGPSQHLRYLLSLDDSTEAAVFETAVGSPGDLKRCGRYFKPNIGVITNIGIDHLDHCKTLEAYIKAKSDMLRILDPQGTLILNADDENIRNFNLSIFKGNILFFGLSSQAHYRASRIEYTSGGMKFTLTYGGKHYSVFVPGYGTHQVYNALAALAAVHALGTSLPKAIDILSSFKLLKAHFEPTKGLNNALIINDTYSLNPTSLESGIKTMCEMANGRLTIALIPNIDTLGQNTKSIHYQVGDMVAKSKLDVLITMGEDARIIATQCRKKGFTGKVYSFKDTKGVKEFLTDFLDENSILLIKCDMYDTAMKSFLTSLT